MAVRTGMAVIATAGVLLAAVMTAQEKKETGDKGKAVSFKDDVMPILKKRCLPCHAESEENPSELSLDGYDLLMKGGKHGDVVVAGEAEKSPLVQKLHEDPPFGKRMPLNSRKKIQEGKAVWLSDADVETIATWVNEGAKDN